jgi:outer membrane protein assembly factor BamB
MRLPCTSGLNGLHESFMVQAMARQKTSYRSGAVALVALSIFAQADPANWNQFRGPNGSGVGDGFEPPIRIVAEQAAWRSPMPPGNSSPILWGSRVFLTGVEDRRLMTLAVDAKSGDILWKRLAPSAPLEPVHRANSHASSTPCADDGAVYAYFGSYGLLCYDHQGRERWKRATPTPKSMYGTSTSPILHNDRLILVLDDDENLPDSQLSRSKVIALDKTTGEPLWKTPRPYNRGAWSTPMIWTHQHGTDLVVLGNGRVYGYEPTTGSEKWYANGFAREPIAVPVAGDGQLYVSVPM